MTRFTYPARSTPCVLRAPTYDSGQRSNPFRLAEILNQVGLLRRNGIKRFVVPAKAGIQYAEPCGAQPQSRGLLNRPLFFAGNVALKPFIADGYLEPL